MSMKALYDLRDMVCVEIEKTAKKEKISSVSELDLVDKLTHALKSIDTIIAMQEAQEYENGYSERGYSDARGRNARRDSMGRYSRNDGRSYGGSYRNEGGSYRDGSGNHRDASYDGGGYRGYSNDGDMIDKMHRMIEQASTEEERKAIRKIMNEMEK